MAELPFKTSLWGSNPGAPSSPPRAPDQEAPWNKEGKAQPLHTRPHAGEGEEGVQLGKSGQQQFLGNRVCAIAGQAPGLPERGAGPAEAGPRGQAPLSGAARHPSTPMPILTHAVVARLLAEPWGPGGPGSGADSAGWSERERRGRGRRSRGGT